MYVAYIGLHYGLVKESCANYDSSPPGFCGEKNAASLKNIDYIATHYKINPLLSLNFDILLASSHIFTH